jgi:hypothetical protein
MTSIDTLPTDFTTRVARGQGRAAERSGATVSDRVRVPDTLSGARARCYRGVPVTRTARTLERTAAGRAAKRHGPTWGLAYVGCVDTPRQDLARWVWIGDAETIRLGRGAAFGTQREGAELQVAVADRRLSKNHAVLVREADGFAIRDEGSTNGTFVGPQRVTEPRRLRKGDTIETGSSFWRLVEYRPQDDAEPIGEMSAAVGPTRTICPALVESLRRLAKVVTGNLPIVLLGETGAGKEVLARQIHERSKRPGDFLALNCGAVPAALLESELFGHARGAFTGATGDQPGIVESADAGTLFLDEIGELPVEAQVKLLRVLQEGEVVRRGERRSRRVDVRVVAATHRDVAALVRQERFRADLFGRLTGFTMRLPPLRERLEDLGILVAHFLDRASDATDLRLDVEVMRALLAHPWPFNVRGLERVVRAAVELCAGGPKVRLEHVDAALEEMAKAAGPAAVDRDSPGSQALWREHQGNVSAVARALGRSRTQVYRLLSQHGIGPGRPES